MVYKGAKWLCYLNISAYLEKVALARGASPAALRADKVGYAQTMQIKAARTNQTSAMSVAQQTATLPNQSGGNVGFTYE